jgi:hypothetical protein
MGLYAALAMSSRASSTPVLLAASNSMVSVSWPAMMALSTSAAAAVQGFGERGGP